jgi:hypothetical protein
MSDKLNGASAFFKNAVENGMDTIFATTGTSKKKMPWVKADDGIQQYQKFIA